MATTNAPRRYPSHVTAEVRSLLVYTGLITPEKAQRLTDEFDSHIAIAHELDPLRLGALLDGRLSLTSAQRDNLAAWFIGVNEIQPLPGHFQSQIATATELVRAHFIKFFALLTSPYIDSLIGLTNLAARQIPPLIPPADNPTS